MPFSAEKLRELAARGKGITLLKPTGNEVAERAAIAKAERPGTWFGEPGADGRALTQEETDQLIRTELLTLVRVSEYDEAREILGDRAMYPRLPDLGRRAQCQRGGIDSDPLVRLLAF